MGRHFTLKPGHPLIEQRRPCPVCWKNFEAGDPFILVPTRVPQDRTENVPAVIVHWHCANDEPPPD